ncbi:hypothetical protein [Neorhizobium sp. AL 9.2.2]|uniref:hypothetical protein n=1 Tax=Neorhizobium sp. AL 9.2.2 TaxID=2712894 RepID=UPI001573E949|nr:hypothetical protein [Neorhizobium sp. AL 9.2.2]NSY18546.1 hypothetical protein [Neorhizobium sp. AL 9.2.2]
MGFIQTVFFAANKASRTRYPKSRHRQSTHDGSTNSVAAVLAELAAHLMSGIIANSSVEIDLGILRISVAADLDLKQAVQNPEFRETSSSVWRCS